MDSLGKFRNKSEDSFQTAIANHQQEMKLLRDKVEKGKLISTEIAEKIKAIFAEAKQKLQMLCVAEEVPDGQKQVAEPVQKP